MKTINQLIYMIRNNIEFDESATQDLLDTLCKINNEKINLNNTIEQLRKNNRNLKNELDELWADFEEKCDDFVALETVIEEIIKELNAPLKYTMLKKLNK